MPPLIVAMIVGAGAYAGIRIAGRIWSQLSEAGSEPEAPPPEKDLGPLELDPATGVYRPRPRE